MAGRTQRLTVSPSGNNKTQERCDCRERNDKGRTSYRLVFWTYCFFSPSSALQPRAEAVAMSFHSTDVYARSRLDLLTAVSIAKPTDRVRMGCCLWDSAVWLGRALFEQASKRLLERRWWSLMRRTVTVECTVASPGWRLWAKAR